MKRILIGALAVGAIGATTLAAESAVAAWYGPSTYQPVGTWSAYPRGSQTVSYAVGNPHTGIANATVSANATPRTTHRAQSRCSTSGWTTYVSGPAVYGAGVGGTQNNSYAFCTQQLTGGRGQLSQ